ncbi:MAG: dihydrofolate reductase [Defluviitaleaceae bacterium]|nr:dihydrofolate reductase [Defluviitaleaceae bacterium]
MNLIAAVSSNWGIGYKNRLLFHIHEDLQRFKELTINKTVVMGHNTFKSLPGGKPLSNRVNIVLSREKNLQIPGVTICDSLSALEIVLQSYSPENIFIIGGENIYTQLLNRCKLAYITKVDANPSADVFMPNIDKLPDWKLIEEILPKKQCEIAYRYSIYANGLFFYK